MPKQIAIEKKHVINTRRSKIQKQKKAEIKPTKKNEEIYEEESPHDDKSSESQSISNHLNPKQGKKQQPKQQNINSNSSQDPENSGQEEDDQDEDEDENSQSSSEIETVKPQNYAIKNMQFRQRRGTKMNQLINRKKEEEEDSFWQQQGQNYFGDLDDENDDAEDYVQSSSGRDEFDSDFNQTQSEHQVESAKQERVVDQDEAKERKKRHELMRKIHNHPPTKKIHSKNNQSPNTIEKKAVHVQKNNQPLESTNRYIHQVCSQQELLGEAATTQYYNWLSLQKLISIETEKKDFAHKEHHIEGPKSIFRDRIEQNGQRAVSYELSGVLVQDISDLTQLWKS